MRLIELVEHHATQLAAAGVHFGHGTTNAFDEAAWLVQWRLGLALDTLQTQGDRPVDAAGQAQVAALIQQRIQTRKPAAYLTGEAWLQGVPFFVNEHVIVPRSLIAELLADGSIDAWLSEQTQHVLDLCTGNGSLAVLAAMAWPDVQVLATDISAEALAVAARNVQRHGLQDRITLAEGDGLWAAPGRHDLILCNPPYVNAASMALLPEEYRAEPPLALDGGRDGMGFIRRLMHQARAHLSDEGVMVLEIGHERENFEAAFPDTAVFWLPTSAGEEQVLLVEAQSLP